MTRPPADRRGVLRKERYICRHTSESSIGRHYDTLQQVGSGSFARVNLVRSKTSGQDRACKVVKTTDMQPTEVYAMMKREVDILSRLDHPLVVCLYEYADDVARNSLSMILEYIPGGSCATLLANASRPLMEEHVGRLIHQLLVALRYCHQRGVAHRDVKPENMMLARRPTNADDFDCKLVDFGTATGPDRGLREQIGGTSAYMAPEVLKHAPCSEKVDLWSTGISAVELLTRELPFGKPGPYLNNQRVHDAICAYSGKGELQEFLSRCSWWQGRSRDVLESLLSFLTADPMRRPSAEKALASPWMENCMPGPGCLTQGMAHGLSLYARAPEAVRCCLLIIAVRNGIAPGKEQQEMSAVFIAADTDGDGKVTKQDLQVSGRMPMWSLFESPLDILEASELDESGGLSWIEFMAACLYSRYRSLAELAEETFCALDDDRDGKIGVADIQQLFCERTFEDFQRTFADFQQDRRRGLPAEISPFLGTLPQSRSIGLAEWRWSVCRFHEDVLAPASTYPSESKKLPGDDVFQDFVGYFFPVLNSCARHASKSVVGVGVAEVEYAC